MFVGSCVGKGALRTNAQGDSGVVVAHPVILVLCEAEAGRMKVQVPPKQLKEILSQHRSQIGLEVGAKALGSSPSTATTKKAVDYKNRRRVLGLSSCFGDPASTPDEQA